MMDMLRKEFEQKQTLHNELVSKYNEKMESKKKIEAEMIEIEKELLFNEGAMKMLDDLAVKVQSTEQPAEIITSDVESEIVTEA
nr:MAG TPA: hypothetical protein [Caudoviricetes sp.]